MTDKRGMILIDGIARSGTSLIARLAAMVLEPQGYAYYYEPLQHPTPAGRYENWREMIGRVIGPEEDDTELAAYIDQMNAGAGGGLLWKEIRLALKQEWLLRRWPELRIVHVTRDILGVWSSHRREGAPEWMARHRAMWCEAARRWAEQGEKLKAMRVSLPTDAIAAGADEAACYAAIWAANESFIAEIESERLYRMRYEDLCARPVDAMSAVAEFIDAPFSDALASRMREHVADALTQRDPSGAGSASSEAMPEIWRARLAPDEIATIVRVAGGARRKLGYADVCIPTAAERK